MRIHSWDIVFDPQTASSPIAAVLTCSNTPKEIIPAALNFSGLDPDFTSPDDSAKAEELPAYGSLPRVKKFHSWNT